MAVGIERHKIDIVMAFSRREGIQLLCPTSEDNHGEASAFYLLDYPSEKPKTVGHRADSGLPAPAVANAYHRTPPGAQSS